MNVRNMKHLRIVLETICDAMYTAMENPKGDPKQVPVDLDVYFGTPSENESSISASREIKDMFQGYGVDEDAPAHLAKMEPDCGAVGCILGHYIARWHKNFTEEDRDALFKPGAILPLWARDHFDISYGLADYLFSPTEGPERHNTDTAPSQYVLWSDVPAEGRYQIIYERLSLVGSLLHELEN